MAFELTGTVVMVGNTQTITDKFKKRDLVIEYSDNNPEYIESVKFEAHQANCDKLDELKAGDNVTVHFNIKGKSYTNKDGILGYFNSLVTWKVGINQTVAGEKLVPVNINAGDDDGDLPF